METVALRDRKEATVAQFATGMMVRHSTLGIGRVVAVERTAVHVFFAEGERGDAAKLRLSVAEPFLHQDPRARDERLDNLAPFALDPVSGRYSQRRPRVAARKGKKK